MSPNTNYQVPYVMTYKTVNSLVSTDSSGCIDISMMPECIELKLIQN